MRFRYWLLVVLLMIFGVMYAPCTLAAQSLVTWDRYSGASAGEMTSLYVYQIGINEQYSPLTPSCAETCSAPVFFPFVDGQTYSIRFRVACAGLAPVFGMPTAAAMFTAGPAAVIVIPNDEFPPPPNPCAGSAPSPPVPPVMVRPCDYAVPGSIVMETRPVGQTIQGFNPIGPSGTVNNQGDRIRQLLIWGWSLLVPPQFVDGSIRPDKTDRLFLIVQCRGLR